MSDTSIADDDVDIDDPPELDPPEPDEPDAPEGDEPDPDAGVDDPDGTAEPDVASGSPKPSRATARVKAAVDRAKEAEDRAARFERELNEVKQAITARQTGPTPEQIERERVAEEQRLALMTPEERIDYRFQQQEARHQRERHQDRIQAQETADQAGFRALQATDPLARKYADEVEQVVREQKANGMFTPREVALNYVLGKKLRERSTSSAGKQRKAAEKRVAGATTKPGRVPGDQAADRGDRRGGDFDERAFEKRYGNVTF